MRLKVGDKLKVLKDAHWNTALKRGDIITIEEIVGEVFHTNGRWAFTDTPDCMQGFELVEPKGKHYTIKGKTYYAFPEGKTIKELGIDTSRKFIVVDSGNFRIGDVIMLDGDDTTHMPFFNRLSDGARKCKSLSSLAYYDEEETTDVLTTEMMNKAIESLQQQDNWTWGVTEQQLLADYSVKHYLNNLKPTGNKFMSNIVKFAKNMVLSADEKLLRKYGLKGECGEYSDEAREIVMDKLIHDNEQVLIDIAKAKEAEDKK